MIGLSVCSHKEPAKDKAHTGKDLPGKAAEMCTETQSTNVVQCGPEPLWSEMLP